MMMNQGSTTDTMTTLDHNSLEHQVADSSQGQASSYYVPSSAPGTVSWTMHGSVNGSIENGVHHRSSYNFIQAEMASRNIPDGVNVGSSTSTSSSGTANVPQEYSSYTTYPSTDPYGYGNPGYTSYYGNSYQQQTNQSYPHAVGAYQSTGAPNQPLSSFQNAGSYSGPPSYSTTYYNRGDYQTSGGYPSGSYSGHSNSWHQGSYSSYAPQYVSYTSESSGAYTSSNASATSLQYQQQHYKQWADYYSQTEVSCAPGTENTFSAKTANVGYLPPGVTSGYPASSIQPHMSFSPSSWRPETSFSELPLAQPSIVHGEVRDASWRHCGQGYQNYQSNPMQPNFQQSMDNNTSFGSFQDQQKSECPPQGTSLQYSTAHQVVQSYHTSLQTAPQSNLPFDSGRVSKLQIPTNPRIASNLPFGLPKTDKDISTTSAAAKPAYVSVSLPKPNNSSNVAADSMLKPGMFPKSLLGYVERALARCKDELQMAASQAVMKELITKATVDGTLSTRDWDTEPLFPLPNMDMINDRLHCSTPASELVKRRSPSRRTKSRWEPVAEEKPVEKPASFHPTNLNYGGWVHINERAKQLSAGKSAKEENNLGSFRFSLSDQKPSIKNVPRASKRRRIGDGPSGASKGDSSSDSDKEQSLAGYYAGAVALADSPEEKRRRESRSKRFEKNQGNRAANNHVRQRGVGAGNFYARRAVAMAISKSFEDSSSRAVEDIDWDALTVKGTCQDIEKRYLRLTSAPDPATVRPEEILEKALLMVQNSQKNYLYKCDQLKSIRQDLTVQHIRNELTVKVYETHARLAIEVGDLAEYNQCQSQLQSLYAEGIKGCTMEFSAYNLLCVILHSNNNRDLLAALSRLSVEARKDEAVKHALSVRAAVTSGNYVLFFRLYKTAPNLNPCLMDLYIEKMRYAAVQCMSRSYRPIIPVPYIAQVLGFTDVLHSTEGTDVRDTDGLEECVEWLKAHGAFLTEDSTGEMQLDAKASMASLFMPEPEDAVAHGDASLAVDDFLTRASS